MVNISFDLLFMGFLEVRIWISCLLQIGTEANT